MPASTNQESRTRPATGRKPRTKKVATSITRTNVRVIPVEVQTTPNIEVVMSERISENGPLGVQPKKDSEIGSQIDALLQQADQLLRTQPDLAAEAYASAFVVCTLGMANRLSEAVQDTDLRPAKALRGMERATRRIKSGNVRSLDAADVYKPLIDRLEIERGAASSKASRSILAVALAATYLSRANLAQHFLDWLQGPLSRPVSAMNALITSSVDDRLRAAEYFDEAARLNLGRTKLEYKKHAEKERGRAVNLTTQGAQLLSNMGASAQDVADVLTRGLEGATSDTQVGEIGELGVDLLKGNDGTVKVFVDSALSKAGTKIFKLQIASHAAASSEGSPRLAAEFYEISWLLATEINLDPHIVKFYTDKVKNFNGEANRLGIPHDVKIDSGRPYEELHIERLRTRAPRALS